MTPAEEPLLRRSDVIAMRAEPKADTYRKYCVDVVAWGSSVGFDENSIARARRFIEISREAGVRLYAVDCVAVGEGTACVVTDGDPTSPRFQVLGQAQRDYDGAMKQLRDLGVDFTNGAVLDVHGNWIRVPWGGDWRNLPMASVLWPKAREWYLRKMDLIAGVGGTALHIDEPALGSYGIVAPSPGDFSTYATAAFREWLRTQPDAMWRKAGVESFDGFNYREFVLAHGGDARKAPLWREFVRFQLFAAADFIRQMRDRVQAKVGRPVPLSTNANPATWYKLPFLQVQDFMTTEVGHEAKRLCPPITPLLVYKFGDAIGQPVVTTAHGGEWRQMYDDPHPILVCSWLAMGYALGHHLMMPVSAWMSPPVDGGDRYQPKTDHFACLAHFVKKVAPLLDDHDTVAQVAVVVSCDALEKDIGPLKDLLRRLADGNVPFKLSVEGNDLFDRRLEAKDLDGCSVVLIAGPHLLPDDAKKRVQKLAGRRLVGEFTGGELPAALPQPIRVDGAGKVWVLPRVAPGNEQAPVAIHLLNRDYDATAHAMRPKGPFTLTIERELLGPRSFTKALLHQPILNAILPEDGDVDRVISVEMTLTDQTITLAIPALDVWGVVALESPHAE